MKSKYWNIDRAPNPLVSGLLLALATVGAYLAWLGWDQHKEYDADGVASGPYEPWQVGGFVISLAVLAFIAGWWRHPISGAGAITIATTVAWSINAAKSDDSGLWVVGAAMVLIGTLVGTSLVAGLTATARNPKQRLPA